jgi:hypothetical protein
VRAFLFITFESVMASARYVLNRTTSNQVFVSGRSNKPTMPECSPSATGVNGSRVATPNLPISG